MSSTLKSFGVDVHTKALWENCSHTDQLGKRKGMRERQQDITVMSSFMLTIMKTLRITQGLHDGINLGNISFKTLDLSSQFSGINTPTMTFGVAHCF